MTEKYLEYLQTIIEQLDRITKLLEGIHDNTKK